LGSAVEPEVYWRKAGSLGLPPGVFRVLAEEVSENPARAGQLGYPVAQALPRRHFGEGEDERGAAVRRDGAQPRQPAGGAGRIGGHGHHPGVQTAEEGGHEVEARGEEQQGPLRGRATGAVLQPGGDRPRPPVELAEGEDGGLPSLVVEEGVDAPAGALASPPAQHLDPGGEDLPCGGVVRRQQQISAAQAYALALASGLGPLRENVFR
jgi:hypothetical protein